MESDPANPEDIVVVIAVDVVLVSTDSKSAYKLANSKSISS